MSDNLDIHAYVYILFYKFIYYGTYCMPSFNPIRDVGYSVRFSCAAVVQASYFLTASC